MSRAVSVLVTLVLIAALSLYSLPTTQSAGTLSNEDLSLTHLATPIEIHSDISSPTQLNTKESLQ